MKIDFEKAFYTKEVYREKFTKSDEWASGGDEFSYEIVIKKKYTLNGKVWGIEMPNCTMHDKNLFRLMVRAIDYASSEFPTYFRLVDRLIELGYYKKL